MDNDNLEKFITSHKEGFDDMKPPRDMWSRISGNRFAGRTRFQPWQRWLWRAAAVIVIFIASYFVNDYLNRPRHEQLKEAGGSRDNNAMAGTLKEAEAFYTSQINAKKAEVFRFAGQKKEISSEINVEFSQLDSIYADLKKDLKDNADNAQVIEAMIQNYRIKLEILEDILNQLQKSKSNNNATIHEI
jgi:hypothetical protein